MADVRNGNWTGMSPVLHYARVGLWALPVWAVLLVIGTWSRQPDPATDFPAYAEYVTTTWFLISHLVASIAGAAVGILGLIALFVILSTTRVVRGATWGLAAFVIGSVLVTSVFGVAAFAQPAIGNAYLSGSTAEAVAFDGDVYGPAVFATVIPGMLLLMAGMILFGIAVTRSGLFPKWAGYGFAVAGFAFAIGVVDGTVQTIGALLLVAATAWIAGTAHRSVAPGPEPRRTAHEVRSAA